MPSYSHLSSKWLQYWDTEPTGEIHIRYCRELDTETRISLGDFRKKNRMGAHLENHQVPIHTKLAVKQGVSPSKRLMHSCVIPCLHTEMSKSRMPSHEFQYYLTFKVNSFEEQL